MIRSRHLAWNRLTSAATPMNSSQMPPTPTARAMTAEQELGEHLVGHAVAQVGRARRVADQVVDRAKQVRPALWVGRKTRPPTHRPRPISPAIGRTKRDSPGLSVRATATTLLPRNSSGAHHRQVTRPASLQISTEAFRSLLRPAVVDGLQNGIRVGAATVGPLGPCVQKAPAPTLPGIRSDASKPILRPPWRLSAATFSL